MDRGEGLTGDGHVRAIDACRDLEEQLHTALPAALQDLHRPLAIDGADDRRAG